MAYFKRKQFKIEARQVTAETINDIYAWVNAANTSSTANNLTSDSFTLSVSNNFNDIPVRLGSWIVDYHSGNVRIVVIPDAAFQDRFDPLLESDGDMPYLQGVAPPT